MSASGDFGPAPPGVDLSENQNVTVYGAVIALMVIGTIAVVLRVATRTGSKDGGLAVDDYLIFAALLFSWGTGISCFIGIPYGLGKHLQALTKHEFTVVWQVLFAYVMIYATAVTCTKASIIMYYRRIFNLQLSIYFYMFFILGYWITVIVTVCVACRPLPYFWEQYTNPDAVGVCIDVPKFFFGNGIAAMLIDVIILCVPVPIVLGLHMPLSKKLAVIGILLLGSFVCGASIVRIIMLEHNTTSSDPTWSIAPVFVWSCVEPFIGIVCACLPTLAPLFRRWWTTTVTARGSNSGENTGSGSYHRTVDSRLRFGKSKKEWGSLNTHGDEVDLTNEITAAGSTTTMGGSDEALAYPLTSINVREDVEVSWSNSRNK
ncbi:hypothetical protein AJ80_01671 [Polytolypa hystricis UAMH7299]|uniref:Rhodopsin domain-containing protein n=1 Tax=Polytolypa hystricis (strain UAMH7299) TaxID=1447883 RepID=A0A2B7YZG1_POLH7|nr:hypothetical protein AJ80_01671 [Polytolypa hystricis UAMH7299]